MDQKSLFQTNLYHVTKSKKAGIKKYNDELENIYNAIIFNTIDTLKQLKSTDVLDIWVVVSLMCQNGCFSYNKNEWNDDLSGELPKNLEILVKHKLFLNGHGVCRHASIFLQKIYSLLGYDSSVMIGFLNQIPDSKDLLKAKTHVQAKQYIEDFFSYRESDHFDFELQYEFRGMCIINGNHMVTSVNTKDKTFLFDLIHHVIYSAFYPDLLEANWFHFFIPYEKITKKAVKNKLYTSIPRVKIYSYASKTDLNGIESLEQHYKEYLEQVDLYTTFYERNKDILEVAERDIQALRKIFTE